MTETSITEIQNLFVELRESYERIKLAVPSAELFSEASAHDKFVEESGKISAIVQRIRDIQGL